MRPETDIERAQSDRARNQTQANCAKSLALVFALATLGGFAFLIYYSLDVAVTADDNEKADESLGVAFASGFLFFLTLGAIYSCFDCQIIRSECCFQQQPTRTNRIFGWVIPETRSDSSTPEGMHAFFTCIDENDPNFGEERNTPGYDKFSKHMSELTEVDLTARRPIGVFGARRQRSNPRPLETALIEVRGETKETNESPVHHSWV